NLKETRIYVERVMANFWIYRNRLNQNSESLDDVINNMWPIYISKGDIPVNKYTNEEIEYLEDYLEDKEKEGSEEETEPNSENNLEDENSGNISDIENPEV
ncbi:MAG: hypothetical protein IJ638_02915, partial [Alphaproteobacteria bacterium]|nr:hypothetical protein [Alphaproteobacteria bacterium]